MKIAIKALALTVLLGSMAVFAQDKDREQIKKEIMEKVKAYIEKQHKALMEKISKMIDEHLSKLEKEQPKEKEPKEKEKDKPRKPGFLGIQPGELTEEEMSDLEIEGGVKVDEVIPGTAAEKAELESGDIITAVDGEKVKTVDGLIRILRKKGAGTKIKIEFFRDGKKKVVSTTLGERKEDEEEPPPDEDQMLGEEEEKSAKPSREELKKKILEFLKEKEGDK